MSGSTWAGLAFAASLVVAVAAAYRPLGDFMARIFTSTHHTRLERLVYRSVGVDPDADQTWGSYLRSVLAFSAVSVLALFGLLRVQQHLGSPYAVPAMPSAQAFNTAVSFVTNTNWQSYSGESGLGYVAQAVGLAVQNFLSAAVGIAVAVALVRGFARSRTDRVGNFWVDLVRACTRLLLPIAFVVAIVFVAGGMIQNLHHYRTATGLTGGSQTLPGGPVASQEAIKQLGTNGGGFFNANSAHPFEGPTAWTNWISVFLEVVLPFALCRTFGKMVGDKRQGLAIAAVMALLLVGSTAALAGAHGPPPTARSP
jgi:K+-transporting ATPase ATPase A chain